jgi:lysozyme
MNWNPNQVFLPDLSHYEWPADLNALVDAGCVGVIWKCSQGTGYQDPTYNAARAAAYAAGLLWGLYHFADSSDVDGQVNNFLSYGLPTSTDLISLDFEDNGSASMSLADAEAWIQKVEDNLGRPNECVLYSGNRIKETLGNKPSAFWSARRLWLAQYTSSQPDVPAAWKSKNYWIWQFTDGSNGPQPHSASGCGTCDMNAYDFSEDQLKTEWASGIPQPSPPPPAPNQIVTVTIDAPSGISVNVIQNTL